MTRISVYLAWSEGPLGVSTAKDVVVAWRNMTSTSLGIIERDILTSQSHCPWIHSCVGANNQRHFLVYVITLEAGMLLFIRLAVYRKRFDVILHLRMLADLAKTF